MEAAVDQPGEAVDVVLRDGSTARLRPAHSDDRAALLEFYRHLSPESRYFRFFGKPRVDDIVGDVVRAIDSGDAFTLLAEIDRHIVAIGQSSSAARHELRAFLVSHIDTKLPHPIEAAHVSHIQHERHRMERKGREVPRAICRGG